MRQGMRFFCSVFFLAVGFACLTSCQHSQSDSTSTSLQQSVTIIPPDLQEMVNVFVHAEEAFDIPTILAVYAEDFLSSAGRSKDGVREVFTQLKENRVNLEVEKAMIEKVDGNNAFVRTRMRLRYVDHFRDLGEGEVVVTDVLRHSFRKEQPGWKIYTDERLSTYREGHFGTRAPNVQVEVPEQLSVKLEYPVTITVHRDAEIDYQVMVGNYVEDPTVLPPPDIVTALPEDGILRAHLLPNLQGRSEMVRVTVIAAAADGRWVGATTVSRFVPEGTHSQKEEEQELTGTMTRGKERVWARPIKRLSAVILKKS